MNKNKRFFSTMMPIFAVFGSLFLICDFADAATRASSRSAPSARKNIANTTVQNTTTTQTESTTKETAIEETVTTNVEPEQNMEQQKPELIISNKSNQFEDVIDAVMESATPDNSFAEQIRRQRAALAASESGASASNAQKKALATNSHSCDVALRKCMSNTCGKDFTKCALDGDTDFGDKLNKCRKNAECSGEEFSLFGAEIKADRDMNVRLASYNAVIDCGNNYNACIVNECGTTYSKCLGKEAANTAIQKCSIIALECKEADSGLVARFGTAIGKLRENAEKDIKTDEDRLYKLRDLMRNQCKSLGAAFDERSFDCVYSIEFYAGENQSVPLASRKAYAGDSFVCTQEWFGVNTTTAQENAYRETRSQTAASSAMLGSGLGVAAGAITSGAIDRAIDTTKAKNALNKAEKAEDKAQKQEDKKEQKAINKAKRKENSAIVANGAAAAVSGGENDGGENPPSGGNDGSNGDPSDNGGGNPSDDDGDKKKITDVPKEQVAQDDTPTPQLSLSDKNKQIISDIVNGGNPIQVIQNAQINEAVQKAKSQAEMDAVMDAVVHGENAGKALLHQQNSGKPNPGSTTPKTNTVVDDTDLAQDIDRYITQKPDVNVDPNWSPTLEEETSTESDEILQYAEQKKVCEKSGGKFSNGVCSCKTGFSPDTNGKCVKAKNTNTRRNTDKSTNGTTTAKRGQTTTTTDAPEPTTTKPTKQNKKNNKNYKIPQNEIPNITGLGTCQQMAEQAVYCYVITDSVISSPCDKNAVKITLSTLEETARKEYFKLGLNQRGNLKEKWESRSKVLPAVEKYCEDTIIKRSKPSTTTDAPTTTNLAQQNQNTPESNDQVESYDIIVKTPDLSPTVERDKLPQDQCIKALETAFSNGVPKDADDKERYEFHLDKLKNTSVNVDRGRVLKLLHNSNTTNGQKLVCHENNHYYGDCENASVILPLIALYYAKEQLKEIDCKQSVYIITSWNIDEIAASSYYPENPSSNTPSSSQPKPTQTTTNTNNQQPNQSNTNVTTAKSSNIDVTKKAIYARGKTKNGKSCDKYIATDVYNGNVDKLNCADMASGEWDATFSYGRITGTYKCSNKVPEGVTFTGKDAGGHTEIQRTGVPGDASGNYCYCGATNPAGVNWVYIKLENNSDGSKQNCESVCVGRCAQSVQSSTIFRRALFNKK